MNDMKNILRDIGYFGVGAAAVIIEAGAKAGKALIRKGERTLRDNQETVDDLKRKAKDLGDKVKASMEKAKPKTPPVDAAAMTPEEREALRRQLDEADAACEADAVCHCDEPCVCSDDCTCEAPVEPVVPEVAEPVIPDVIYHTDATESEDNPHK